MQLYWAFNVHFGTSYAAFLKSREERAEVLSICPEPKDMPDLPDPRQDISRHMETWERVDCDLAFFSQNCNHHLNQVPVYAANEEPAGEHKLGNAPQRVSEEE